MESNCPFKPFSVYSGDYQIIDRGHLTLSRIRGFLESILTMIGESGDRNRFSYLDERPADENISFFFTQGSITPSLIMTIRIDSDSMVIYIYSSGVFKSKAITQLVREKLFNIGGEKEVFCTRGTKEKQTT